uniref:TIP120 domain-containing protein n=1 Tax=Rhabditophanes sp. KR3021 TaxID=114890 RepID=A0AC35UGK6_9BILA
MNVNAVHVKYNVTALLEKITHGDKDLRFMALNDLLTHVPTMVSIDETTIRRMSEKALVGILDTNGEVQNLSVKFIVMLIKKASPYRSLLQSIFADLVVKIFSEEEKICGAACVTLKGVIEETTSSNYTENEKEVTISCVNELIRFMQTSNPGATQISKFDVFDIILSILYRYNSFLTSKHDTLLALFFELLKGGKLTLRKRAINGISLIGGCLSKEKYEEIMKVLSECLVNANEPENTRVYIMTVIGVCKNTPKLFGLYAESFLQQLWNMKEKYTEDDEFTETILLAFESLILYSHKNIQNYIEDIGKLCATHITHDPFYHCDSDSDDLMETGMFSLNKEPFMLVSNLDNDSNNSESDVDDSDDEDSSWKVRRAAVKCIFAICNVQKNKFSTVLNNYLPILVGRIKEREEMIKIELLQAIQSIITNTRQFLPRDLALKKCSGVSNFKNNYQINKAILRPSQIEIVNSLKQQTLSLLSPVMKAMKFKSSKVKQCCFSLLRTICINYPGFLCDQMDEYIIVGISILNDKNTDVILRLDVLSFMYALLQNNPIESSKGMIQTIVDTLIKIQCDGYYKAIFETVKTISAVIEILGIHRNEVQQLPNDLKSVVCKMGDYLYSLLTIARADQEVKEICYKSCGTMVASFSDVIGEKTKDFLEAFVSGLGNDIHNIPILQAFTIIVNSPQKIDMIPSLQKTLIHIAAYLKQSNRNLKIASLNFLIPLAIRFKNNGMQGQGLIDVVRESPSLILDNDFLISRLALKFMIEIISYYPDQISDGIEKILDAFIQKTKSPLLQGQTLHAALNLLSAIIKAPLANKPNTEELLNRITESVYQNNELHKQCISSISKCVSIIVPLFGNKTKAIEITKHYAAQFVNPHTKPQVAQFNILALGEIGKIYPEIFDDSSNSLKPELLIMSAFENEHDDIKNAAAFALGNFILGNIHGYLPFLFKKLEENNRKQYLLLHALKEVITSKNLSPEAISMFEKEIPSIWDVLRHHAVCKEEGTRNVVAECMGRLVVTKPSIYMNVLSEMCDDDSVEVTVTAMSTIRYMLSVNCTNIDHFIATPLKNVLFKISNPNLLIKKNAVLTFNSAITNKSYLVKSYLGDLLEFLYAETDVKQEHIKIVNMGPFKHVIDQCIDIRKATFECMYTLATHCIDEINVNDFLVHFEKGLADDYDIKMLSYLMVSRFINICPTDLTERVDGIAAKLKIEIQAKTKDTCTDSEFMKAEELKKCAMKVILALRHGVDLESNAKICELEEIIAGDEKLRKLYSKIKEEAVNYRYAVINSSSHNEYGMDYNMGDSMETD